MPGAGACLAGLTAAEVGGLRGWERDSIHVLVAHGARVPPLPGLIVHESKRFSTADIHPAGMPPRTRLPRAFAHAAAGWSAPSTRAGSSRREFSNDSSGLTICGRSWRPPSESAIADSSCRSSATSRAAPAHSFAEISVTRLCRRYGLRVPDEQQFRLDGRRCRYLDAVWRLPERLLVLEVDGGLHSRIANWWRDLARERDVVIRVGTVLRCSTIELRLAPEAVAADLARAGVPHVR